MEHGKASLHPCLSPILLAYFLAVVSVPGSVHSASLSSLLQQLWPQKKVVKHALGFRTLTVRFLYWILMLSPGLLGVPVQEIAWISELEEVFSRAFGFSFYRNLSVCQYE